MIGIDVAGIRVAVTGASGVIGLAIAKAFLENGASVANWDLSESPEAKAAGDAHLGRYRFIQADLVEETQAKAAAQATAGAFGGIDVLVNNAGIIAKQEIEQLDTSTLDRLYRVNIRGAAFAAKYAVPYLKKSGRGRIINMSSVQALLGMETYTPYTFTKAALSGMTRVWALELAGYGITVNAICPGWADTGMTRTALVERMAGLHGLPIEAARELILSYVPQHRLIDPDEIAFAALFLASTLGAAVNGVDLSLDAGVANCAKAGLSMLSPFEKL